METLGNLLNDDIVEAAGNKSLLTALYVAWMKWDFISRQDVCDIVGDSGRFCSLCKRYKHEHGGRADCEKCELQKELGVDCNEDRSPFREVLRAVEAKDDCLFSENAGIIRDALWRLINKQYEKPVEPPVTYRIGQKFIGPCGTYVLASNFEKRCAMINLDGNRWSDGIYVAEDRKHVTEDEFDEITMGAMFTLLGENKCSES